MRQSAAESHPEPRFPFTAIVGQTAMKRALILNAINPKIGGVLIRGRKGTAKSTAVRSLAALLPEVAVLQGCPYSCAPDGRQELCQWCQSGSYDNPPVTRQVRIVDLPVGATEDRLVGSVDIEQAIKTGSQSFEPGLIAATHRGILYIDEVNLLNDHLVDVLLDAAAMGRNYVEREGISVSHAADFILVGTMNPEEGDLRPQLLDRFGLAVEVEGLLPAPQRREVVRRRIDYEADPHKFMEGWQAAEEEERARVAASQHLLPQVSVDDHMLELITDICAEYQVDGLRADIVIYKTASTIAAYEGRTEVTVEDVRESAQLALLHRQRRQPFQQPHLVTEQLDATIDELQNQRGDRDSADGETGSGQEGEEDQPDPSDLDGPDSFPPTGPGNEDSGSQDQLQEELFEVGLPFSVRSLELQPPDRISRRAGGKRTKTITDSAAGRYVAARIPQGKTGDLALDATLRAAAPHQQRRRDALGDGPISTPNELEAEAATVSPQLMIQAWDLREKVRETKTGSLILFVVDASGSMGAQRRMVAVKGAVLSLLLDAYQRRDRVGLISFRGTTAEVLLPPTSSVDLAQARLQEMPTGGRTPLGRGLYVAMETIENERIKDRHVLPLLVLLSDGRANVATAAAPGPSAVTTPAHESPATAEAKAVASLIRDQRIASVVIDTEAEYIQLGLAMPIAEALGAQYLKLEDLRAESLADAVRVRLPNPQQTHISLPDLPVVGP